MGRILQYDGYGIKTLLEGLLRGIAELRSDHEIFILVEPGQSVDWLHDLFHVVSISPTIRYEWQKLIWDHFAVGRACTQLKIDALYAPAHLRPLYSPCPVVVSVPDMMYHRFPHHWTLFERVYFQLGVSMLTSRSAAIAALSESTQKDLIFFYPGVSKKIIEVIYPGVPEGFKTLPQSTSLIIRKKYHLPQPYILYMGGFHPRKNLSGMLDAFQTVMPEIPHELVVLGPSAWRNTSLLDRIQNPPLDRRVRYLGVVPRNELPSFYNQADLFVYPSLYEGFGFPVLEALACGCPTITSNSSSLAEVGGNAAQYIRPGNTAELSQAIRLLLSDPSSRDRLSKLGIKVAEKYSWITMAEKTLSLLERATCLRS